MSTWSGPLTSGTRKSRPVTGMSSARLANHQPQPTAERFVDLLFPETTALPSGWHPAPAPDSQ
jgi:hypothetical protein